MTLILTILFWLFIGIPFCLVVVYAIFGLAWVIIATPFIMIGSLLDALFPESEDEITNTWGV